jgi:Flp pilus assembly protein TadD
VIRGLRLAIDLIALAAAVGFTGSYFPPSLMLLPTITSGGDMASHYYPAAYFRDVLLPRGQMMGWCWGNYAGYPLFQFYFPLAFVGMAALSAFVPLTIAFKLVTVAGNLILPVCAYACLRLLGTPFPGPALAALSTLCFQFMEANSMWGGNLPSMLAGEFTFSLGFALSLVFVGSFRRSVETGRGWPLNAALVAVIGLFHGYPLLWGGLVSLLQLFTTRGWWRRVGLLLCVHGLAILLMAFWLFQLLGYAPWSTAFNVTWIFTGWRDQFAQTLPPILWPPAVIAVVSALLLALRCAWRREPYPRDVAILWGATAISVLFFYTAFSFHVVDIRFLPFFQIGLCLAAAAGAGRLLSALPWPEVWPVAAVLATLPFVQSQVKSIPAWIDWNYSGFESKRSWPVFRDINRHLDGDFRDPRVVYEHSLANESLGTVRAFENLPLFSGRSTLEGLYMQSSVTTPFVFFVQSEISKEISCPLPEWGCSRLDLDRGLEHLRMFNVSQFIVRSPILKELVRGHPGLEREASFGEYEIHRVRGNDGRYAVPLPTAPSLVRTPDWKVASYRWFKGAGPADPVPVFAQQVSEEEAGRFAAVFDELPKELPRQPLGKVPALEEELDTGRITLTGARTGHPILIRMSYHPRWRALTGERIWLAGPSFMLVFPRGERVELAFEAGPVLRIGRVFTAAGLALWIAALVPATRRLGRRALGALVATAPIALVVGLLRRTGEWSERSRRSVLAAGTALLAALVSAFVWSTAGANADALYREGIDLFSTGHLREAVPYFQQAQRLAPLSQTSFHARYFEALVYFRNEEWAEAEALFREQAENFPEAPNAPESLYHVGICRAKLGDSEGAERAWRQTVERFPGNTWAGHARARLDEIERAQRPAG